MDTVKALKEIVEKYAGALGDDKKIRALLKDYFPEDKRTQNTLLMAVDEEILEDMQGKSQIKKFQMLGYIKGISNDYGVSEQVAKTAVMNRANALGIDAEDVPVTAESATTKVKIKGDVVDYSSMGIDDFSPNGKVIKFSGSGAKVIPNVKLSGGSYIIRAAFEGEYLCVHFYDGKGQKFFLVNGERETVFAPYSHMDFSKPGVIEVSNIDSDWSVELIPM